MKRFILFIACMILSFSACSNQNNDGRQVADNINSLETAITTSDSNVGTIHSSDTSNTPAASEKTDATAAAITTPSSENNTFSRESSETLPPSVTENTATEETTTAPTTKNQTTADITTSPVTENAAPEETVPTSKPSSITENSYTSDSITLNYLLYTPEDATANMPLIVYLHGGSGKGNDLSLLTASDGFPLYLKSGKLGSVPAYVIMPQLSSSYKSWENVKEALIHLINYITGTYDIDTKKISLTGHSMGGTGTWNIALSYPDKFSCIVPMSGSIRLNETNLHALSSMKIWTFVGSADTVVDPGSTEIFIEKLSDRNPNVKLTVLDGADHFAVPSLAYLNKSYELIGWMLLNRK